MVKKKGKEEEKDEGIVGGFLENTPLLGDLFKELGKTEVFKEKFKETDEKIKENLRKGEKKRWSFESNISVRPILDKAKEETSDISLHEDYFYGKKGNKLIFAVKVPKEEVNWQIKGKYLLVTTDNFEKKIELPGYYREIKKKQYQKGVLVLELTK